MEPESGDNPVMLRQSPASRYLIGHKLLFLGLILIFALPNLALADGICQSVTGNLIVNCSFETGDFTGWTQGGNTSGTQVTGILFGVDENTLQDETYDPNSGDYHALLGPVGSDGTLSQTFATTPGVDYAITFYMASEGGSPTDFSAMFSSTTLLDLNPVPDQFYTEYNYTVAATASSSTLTFEFRSDPGFNLLDDVSVVVTGNSAPASAPEPGTCVLLGAGLLGLAALTRHRC